MIAEREGLSVKQCRRARDERLRTAAPPPLDTDALVERVLRGHVVALERLEALAREADNSSAKGLATVGTSLVGLLARLGRVDDPGLARFAADVRLAFEAMYALADRHGIPESEVVAAVERLPLTLAGLKTAA